MKANTNRPVYLYSLDYSRETPFSLGCGRPWVAPSALGELVACTWGLRFASPQAGIGRAVGAEGPRNALLVICDLNERIIGDALIEPLEFWMSELA